MRCPGGCRRPKRTLSRRGSTWRTAGPWPHSPRRSPRTSGVHQVYNNAGIAGGGPTIAETDYDSFERVLGVNLWGVIHGTTEFLPHLIASGDGHVIDVSSLNGFMAQPRFTPYVTSKFAVRDFTEALRTEKLAARLPVAVTVVHPGVVRTNISWSSYGPDSAGIRPNLSSD